MRGRGLNVHIPVTAKNIYYQKVYCQKIRPEAILSNTYKYFQKNIFEPLGMVDTGFYCPKDNAHRLASLYEHNPTNGPKLLDPSGKEAGRTKERVMLSGG